MQSYTLKRIDPWSVLKFGALISVVVFFILTLTVGFVWFILSSFDLINRGCDVALDVGFSSCDITAGTVFRGTALVAGLIAIVHTAVLVFAAFLYNLIAELTGGIGVQLSAAGEIAAPKPRAQRRKKSAQSPPAKAAAPASAISDVPPRNATGQAPHTPVEPPVAPPLSRPSPPTNPTAGMQRDELFD